MNWPISICHIVYILRGCELRKKKHLLNPNKVILFPKPNQTSSENKLEKQWCLTGLGVKANHVFQQRRVQKMSPVTYSITTPSVHSMPPNVFWAGQ